MAHGLAIQFLRFGCLPLLLAAAGGGRASEPPAPARPTGEVMPALPVTATRSVLCRVVPSPRVGRQVSTCIADHLADRFYRRIALCRGVDGCVLRVPALKSLRLWSPDSRTQFTTFTTPLLSSYTFPVFARTAKVTKGPWISGAGPNTMVVRWETDRQASSWLRVVNRQLATPHLSQWVQGTSSCPDGNDQPCLHTVFVNDLQSDQSYSYLLGDVQPNATTGLHPRGQLTTQPSLPADKFDVRGDTLEVRAYNYAYDAAGQRVASGSGDTWYSTLDCFAINAKGESIPPQNACKP